MGTVYQRANSPTWYMKYKDLQGAWIPTPLHGVTTKAEALHELRKKESELFLIGGGDPSSLNIVSPTVGELIEWYCMQHTKGKQSLATRSALYKHLVQNDFGRCIAANALPRDVRRWMHRLSTEHQLAASTINWLRGLLGAAFNTAKRESWPAQGMFNNNPAYNTLPWRDTATEAPAVDYPVLRPEQVAPVIAALPPQHRAFYASAIYLGARLGELINLRFDDVDFAAMRVYIRKSKTAAGVRAIPLNTELAPWLAACVAESKDRYGHLGCDLVFPAKQGRPRRQSDNYSGILRDAITAAGCMSPILSDMTFHDLRHTTVSLLVEAGATYAEVQAYIGHANSIITRKVYTHLSKDHMAGIAKRMEGKFGLGQLIEDAVGGVAAAAAAPVLALPVRIAPQGGGILDYGLPDGSRGLVTADELIVFPTRRHARQE